MLSEDELALRVATREAGSLSRATARLDKAPSTVSHAAWQLEQRFDAFLFDRRRYRLQLTRAGEVLTKEPRSSLKTSPASRSAYSRSPTAGKIGGGSSPTN